MDYCVVEYAGTGIAYQATTGIQSIRVNNTTVRNGTGTGIYAGAYGGSSVTVEVKNNTVSGNGSVGIYIDGRTSGS